MTQSDYLPVQEALTKVLALVNQLPAETVPLIEASGRILAENIFANDSLPPFDNSGMDGYALKAADTSGASETSPILLKVVGEVAAGFVYEGTLKQGEAIRIMTGAPIPAGVDAVIRIEDTGEAYHESVRPLPEMIAIKAEVGPANAIRNAGSDLRTGDKILNIGRKIRPQEIGVLASLGVSQVPVIRRPKVGILATGDELIPVDAPLTPGKIRNSNEYTQAAQIEALGAEAIRLGVAKDTPEDLRAKLQAGLNAGVDLFISSAGVSVGVYDVVTDVLQQSGDINFWKVRMRPGKPLAAGHYAGTPYLGLPGNPVSAMVSFERFARPAILKMGGHTHLDRPMRTVTFLEAMRSDGRETYVRAIINRQSDGSLTAISTGNQGSHVMTSLVKANGLVIIPEGVDAVEVGEKLEAFMTDWPETVF
ncbi:MAG: molybdopterin molybdotransferase [Cellvibrionaceae bacterium]|jgi:molybdopterin molybdotransferase